MYKARNVTVLCDVLLFKCQDKNLNKQMFYSPLLLLHQRQRNGKSHAAVHAAAVFSDKA